MSDSFSGSVVHRIREVVTPTCASILHTLVDIQDANRFCQQREILETHTLSWYRLFNEKSWQMQVESCVVGWSCCSPCSFDECKAAESESA